MCAHVWEVPKFWEHWGQSLEMGAYLTLETRRSPYVTYSLPNLVVLCQTAWAYTYRNSLEEMGPSGLSRSLKVIETDADRWATCDFLLVIHSNHGPIPYHFRDKRRFRSKISNFPTPMYLTHQLRGFHWKFVTAVAPKD